LVILKKSLKYKFQEKKFECSHKFLFEHAILEWLLL
jgi:hypothetical protein